MSVPPHLLISCHDFGIAYPAHPRAACWWFAAMHHPNRMTTLNGVSKHRCALPLGHFASLTDTHRWQKACHCGFLYASVLCWRRIHLRKHFCIWTRTHHSRRAVLESMCTAGNCITLSASWVLHEPRFGRLETRQAACRHAVPSNRSACDACDLDSTGPDKPNI